jgi:hypothetical protein
MRRGGLSLIWLILGIAAGLGVGLFYAWQVDPRVVTDIRPAQLSKTGQRNYLIALSLAYARDHDLLQAANRLNDLGQDWQALADTACEMAQSGDARTSTGLLAIRGMVDLASSQGRAGCASSLIQAATATAVPQATVTPPTPTRVPVASKTPTLGPTFTPEALLPTFTPTPSGDFGIALTESLCDAQLQGVIEIVVRDLDDTGIAAVSVEVSWTDGNETFFTGLKPERDPGYADYTMKSGETYQVMLPGLSERTRRLQAGDCTTKDGKTAQASYRVIFKRLRSTKK